MKNKILLLAAALAAFYLHGRVVFSEPQVMSWMQEHLRKTMTGDSAFCDDFADDLKVALTSESDDGPMEMQGGKTEMCDYTKQAVAAFRVIRASTQSRFDQVRVVRSGFPWLKAEVTYVQTMTVQARGIPSLTTESEDALVLVRTLSGLKIKSVTSHATDAAL